MMLRTCVVYLWVVCLTHASHETVEVCTTALTTDDFSQAVQTVEDQVSTLRSDMNTLSSKIIDGDKEWLGIMTDIASLIKDGFSLYASSLNGITDLSGSLFDGAHNFQRVSRCANLDKITKTPGFGTREFFNNVEVAMAKDLLCFSNMLREITDLNLRSNYGCVPREDDVIDLLAVTTRHLFQLRNDGERFFHAMVKVTGRYNWIYPHMQWAFYTEVYTLELVALLSRTPVDK